MKKRVIDEEGSDSIAVGVDLPQDNRDSILHRATRSEMIIGEKFEDSREKHRNNYGFYDSDAVPK